MKVVSARGRPFTVTLSCRHREVRDIEKHASRYGRLPLAVVSDVGDHRDIVIIHAPRLRNVEALAALIVHETLHGVLMSWGEWRASASLDECPDEAIALWRLWWREK